MPRAEVGTPKYLANKMKSKGLQKLRWYCQMCQKQCRDENGFKCHTMSESHQRQLLLFADNSKRLIDDFSYEFAKGYIDILSRQFGTKRVNANKVYQEYITDKNHLHMNATRWVTLTGFVKWLGKTGKCKVDETEKGWFITYIDRSPETIEKEKRREKKLKMDKDDDERMAEFLERQRKHDEERGAFAKEGPLYTDLLRNDEEETLKLDLKLNSNKKQVEIIPLSKLLKRSVVDDDKKSIASSDSSKKRKTESKKSVLGEILEEEESKKEKLNRKQYWLHENIVVKVVTKKLGDKYYKQKGVVKEVVNNYIGIVKLLDSGSKLKVDQEDLETVLPAIGKQVKVVNGAYRGEVAKLLSLNVDKFCASIEISAGLQMGKVLNNVQYEDICKLAEQ